MMRAFSLQKLRVISYYFSSDLHNIRKTSFSWNPILSSRKLHDAPPPPPPAGKLLHGFLDRLTIEREKLWNSREDFIDGQIPFELEIEKVRSTSELNLIRHLLQSMPVQLELELEEETYGPLLKYIINMGDVGQFQIFSKLIKDHIHNSKSISRLGYYDMLMWIRVNDEAMIRYACEYIIRGETDELRENYLLALCESDDRKAQISDVFKNTDVAEFTSTDEIFSNMFKLLGRLQLKSEAEKLLLDCYDEDYLEEISNFIDIYAFSIPNLEVEHIIKEIENLHGLLKISPTFSLYEKLILYCCGKNKVDVAINIVDKMCEAYFMPSSHVMQSVLETCSETNQNFQVDQISSILSRHRLHHFKINEKIYWLSAHFSVVMKDYYEEMEQSEINFAKEVFVALLHAYAAYDEFEKAKQVVQDQRIPVKWLIEIKRMLVSSLASHGKLSEALVLLEEIKKAGQTLNPRAVLCLMDVLCSHGELERGLLLRTGLSGEDWVEGCEMVMQYSVQYKNLSSTIEMFKQLKDHFESDDAFKRGILFGGSRTRMYRLCAEAFYLIFKHGSTHLQFGLDLLDLIKKEVVGLVPSSECLNYLLSVCAKSRDLNKANLVWKEYALAGYPYGEDCYWRMYHALLASGEHKSADSLLVNKIPSSYSGLSSDLKHSYRHSYVKKNDVPVFEFELASYSWFAPLNSMKTRKA
ncbi:pentatricopeptide repeat-containing protein At4g21880, mitochondrial [Medicago truncatula]|nr:pentatricopeptide repeat-containing protein At4g21880, mitochondrial [Medicago truncatula]